MYTSIFFFNHAAHVSTLTTLIKVNEHLDWKQTMTRSINPGIFHFSDTNQTSSLLRSCKWVTIGNQGSYSWRQNEIFKIFFFHVTMNEI